MYVVHLMFMAVVPKQDKVVYKISRCFYFLCFSMTNNSISIHNENETLHLGTCIVPVIQLPHVQTSIA